MEVSMLTHEAVSTFLIAKASVVAPRTLEGYRLRLTRFAESFAHMPTEPEPLEAYCGEFANAGQRDTHWRTIGTLYRWLVRRRKINPADNPMLYAERPKVGRKVPRAFTDDELRQLFGHPHEGYVRLLMVLLLRTGLRLGEAMSLRSSAECLRDATIVISGKTGEREVPCDKEMLTVLRYMLPWPWKDALVASHMVARAMKAAGLTGRRASAHSLRHTFARRYKGDSHNLAGILWGHDSRMLGLYRPFNIDDCLEEYNSQSWVA
jgi:integrase